jgi:hypothetical protein
MLAAAVLAVAVPAVTALDLRFPGRSVLALAFLLTIPGVPLVALLRLPDVTLRLSLAVAGSMAASLVLSTASLVAGWWHPLAATCLLSVVGLSALPFAARLRRMGPHSQTGWQPRREQVEARLRRTLAAAQERKLALVALLDATLLWFAATRTVDLDAAGPRGVIAVVGWPYLLGLALVALVAGRALLSDRPDHVTLALATFVLTVVLYAFVNVADGSASVPTGWLHVGFARYISDHGAVPAAFDARFSWPGFFAALAQLVTNAGTADARPFLALAPTGYNLLALPPLFVIARCVTRSDRLAWLSLWLYLCFNWYQQDYLAPQATAYLLYLVVIATLIWLGTSSPLPQALGSQWTRAKATVRRVPGRPPGVRAPAMRAVLALVLLLAVGLTVSHQLTPVTLVLAMIVFTLTGHTRFRLLWLSLLLIAVGWFSYGAQDYWAGHLSNISSDFGKLGSTVNSSLSDRLVGNPTYHQGQLVRVAWSAGLVTAAAGGLWLLRHHRDVLLFAGLAGAPFCLVLLQSYGGEVLLRCFVFGLPVLAPLAAIAVASVLSRLRLVRPAALAALLATAALALTFTRGLNTSFERAPKQEVAASQFLFTLMPRGSTIGLLGGAGFLGFARTTDYSTVDLTTGRCLASSVACARELRPQFILATRTQDRLGQLQSSQPAQWTESVVGDLVSQGLYQRVYRTTDAQVLVLRSAGH